MRQASGALLHPRGPPLPRLLPCRKQLSHFSEVALSSSERLHVDGRALAECRDLAFELGCASRVAPLLVSAHRRRRGVEGRLAAAGNDAPAQGGGILARSLPCDVEGIGARRRGRELPREALAVRLRGHELCAGAPRLRRRNIRLGAQRVEPAREHRDAGAPLFGKGRELRSVCVWGGWG